VSRVCFELPQCEHFGPSEEARGLDEVFPFPLPIVSDLVEDEGC
jgi:hypothetical protein